jgi:nitrate reductase gamma subunit
MSKRTIGVVVVILGMVLVIVSLAADALGIGHEPGIGLIQILGAVAGGVVALGGVWLVLRKPGQKK